MKREESLKKLKGIWNKISDIRFRTDDEFKLWRKSLWFSTEKRIKNSAKLISPKKPFLVVFKL